MREDEQNDLLLIEQMLEMIRRVWAGLDGGGEQAGFMADPDKIDATATRLLVIGEASSKLSSVFRVRHAEIAWRNIYAFRNLVAHHYDRIDPARLWDIATRRLDAVEAVCRQELEASGRLDRLSPCA